MEMDTDLYKNKIIDDLFFITNTLAKIEEIAANSSISEKEFLVLLKKVKILKDSVIILMENIIKYKYKQAIIFETQTNKIKSFISQYKISSAEIQKKLNKKQFSSQSENLVSKEELCFLFGQEAPG
ncbi:MAG: hypothetical protein FWC36_03470 [Spirochaetes bacterium]|nr:hypothetical protein [Spirochaetota bacterium]